MRSSRPSPPSRRGRRAARPPGRRPTFPIGVRTASSTRASGQRRSHVIDHCPSEGCRTSRGEAGTDRRAAEPVGHVPQSPGWSHSATTMATTPIPIRYARRVVGEVVAQQVVQDRADDRALDGADAADHDDEDDRRRPLDHAERRPRLHPQLRQVVDRTRRTRSRSAATTQTTKRVRYTLAPSPRAPPSLSRIACICETEPGAQDQIGQQHRADAGDQREPVGHVLARLAGRSRPRPATRRCRRRAPSAG